MAPRRERAKPTTTLCAALSEHESGGSEGYGEKRNTPDAEAVQPLRSCEVEELERRFILERTRRCVSLRKMTCHSKAS